MIPMKETLLSIFSDVLGGTISEQEINRDNSAWDSLGHLNIILAIEEEFNLDIPPEDFQTLHSDLPTIIQYLESH
jgi:acyl carrier protein